MRVGLIAEGPADLAVLCNLVRGVLGVARDDLHFIRPELTRDETELHTPGEEHFSNWLLVKQECTERARIDEFLGSPVLIGDEDDGRKCVVIQIDAAECHLPGFDVERPSRGRRGRGTSRSQPFRRGAGYIRGAAAFGKQKREERGDGRITFHPWARWPHRLSPRTTSWPPRETPVALLLQLSRRPRRGSGERAKNRPPCDV